MQTIYIIYLYIVNVSIYKYAIYLLIMLILLVINTITLKKKGNQNYTIQILILCTYLAMATTEKLVILSVMITLLLVAIKQMIINEKNDKEQKIKNNEMQKIPFGFYLCFTNIIMVILQNYI